MNDHLPYDPDDEGHNVVLPCSPSEFGSFIGGLLGRPQTISATVNGPFEIERKNVENIHHLLEQRIHAQNQATLIQLTVQIMYNDKSSVLVNSLEEFLAYNEVRPLVSVGLIASWTYLVKFPTKEYPEKQVVQIDFNGGARPITIKGGPILIVEENPAIIGLRIEHTNRTWGADIEALLRGHLEMLKRSIPALSSFAQNHAGKIGFITAMLGMIFTSIASFKVGSLYADDLLHQLEQIRAVNSVQTAEYISRQIEFMAEQFANGYWFRFSTLSAFLTIAAFIASIALGVVVSEKACARQPSFLLLTEKSKVAKREMLEQRKNNWWKFALSVIGAIVVGVVGNLAFYWLLKALAMDAS